jgi:phosphatidylglycerol:prolipoprotein diacylglycerol transferase
MEWLQNLPEKMSPVFISLGSLQIHYYGLMYILAIGTAYMLVQHRLKSEPKYSDYLPVMISDSITALVMGILIGGRLGYVLFYNFGYYLKHPIEIILPFSFDGGEMIFTGISGMSYHGGLIGVTLAYVYISRKLPNGFWRFSDLMAPAIPLGYTFGRLGNFINGELYGRVTEKAWGMYFKSAPTHELRHASQLYEGFFEGIILFVALWSIRKKSPFDGFLSGLYLILYGLFRFFIEYVREPDTQLSNLAGPFTMGQLLCIAMMVSGAAIIIVRNNQTKKLEIESE